MRVGDASWGEELNRPQHGRRLVQLWWAVRVVVWLCGLPIRWRTYSLPTLLHHLTPRRKLGSGRDPWKLDQVVCIVRRLCRLRCFGGPLFPQVCLRQALTLYHFLSLLGYPVAIHVGVYKAGEALRGHSWVTVEGQPVAECLPPQALQVIYSFPVNISHASQERSSASRPH
jgi:transglutaminase superfamily protein